MSNSLVEMVNGIFKDSFLLNFTFKDYDQVLRAVRQQAMKIYHKLRPHWSFDLKSQMRCT
ncbi:MAG TPA: hypothetical protein VLZ33_06700 [Dysgonamonadaceae bacterium]|nr:hypothetical protein [Dysgonamonadaceae bacterium]